MWTRITNYVDDIPKNIETTILEMGLVQWGIVAVTAVALGFLLLRTKI